MPTNKKILSQDAVSTSDPDSEQSLVLYLDANDEDSIESGGANTGAGSGTWFDIANHDLNVPLTDNNDNLEIHIDASNTNSYGGSGSTITDISTNGYSFSTHGNAAFGSDLRGYFTLDGSDDGLRTTDAVTGFSGDVTFEWWFNASESNNFALLHANPLSNDSGINGIFIGNAAGGAGAIEIYRKTTGGTLHSGQSSSTGLSGMASDGWVHFVITITSANVCNFYKDGTKQGTLTLNGNGTNHDTYNFVSIGGYNNASYEFAGKIGCFRMYSEILSNSEIAQNFRAGNFINYSSIITSKHEATQGTLYSTNLTLSLDANGYTSGTWSNTANSSYNATVSGATYTNDGNSDYFDFDGSNDYAEVGAYTGADIGSGGFTLEAWCLCEASSGADTIASNLGPSDTTGYQLYIDAGTGVKLYIYSDSSNYRQLTTTSAIAQGTWNHCVFTVASASNGAAIKLYVNGIEKDSDTLNSNYTGADHGLDIGRYPYNNTKYFDGKIAQVRTYSAALTSAQVTTNYNATKALYQNPNLNMNLDAATYTSGAWGDSVGSNDGTISGASFDKELGNYFDLDGSNDKITVAGADLNPANTKSIGVWFNTDSTSSEQYIISNWSGSGNNYGYHLIADSGTLKAWIYSQAQNAYFANLASGGTITAGKWHYAVLNIGPNASDNKLFLDGVLTETESSTSGTFPTTAAHNGIIIGAYGANVWFNGKIGQIKAYSTQLTSAQVAQNYLATKNNYPNGFNFSVDGPTFSTNSSPAYNYFRSDAAAEKLLLSSVDIDITMGYTISLYLRRHATTGTYQQQFRMTGDGFTSYLFLIAGYGDVRYFYSSGTGTEWSTYGSSGDWTTDWINVIHVREANGAGTTNNRGEIYINGVSHATNNSLTAATNITRIGFGDNITTSRVDNVDSGAIKLWQKPFSDAEALAEFNATKTTYGL